MDIQDTNRATELEQYLRSRINSIPYRDLIKEIRVDEGDSESSLKITLVPVDDVVTFSRISIRPAGIDTEAKWRRRKKDAYRHVKGAHPGVSRPFKEKIQRESGEKLEIWRLRHPFSEEMADFLSASAAEQQARRFNLRGADNAMGSRRITIGVRPIRTLRFTVVKKRK